MVRSNAYPIGPEALQPSDGLETKDRRWVTTPSFRRSLWFPARSPPRPDLVRELLAYRLEPLLGGATGQVLSHAGVFVHPAHPDPPRAHVDELGIGPSIGGSRGRHCPSGPDGDRRGARSVEASPVSRQEILRRAVVAWLQRRGYLKSPTK
jgi:hypothetical protein